MSQGQKLEKLSHVEMNVVSFLVQQMRVGLDVSVAQPLRIQGHSLLHSWASAFCSASAVEVGSWKGYDWEKVIF